MTSTKLKKFDDVESLSGELSDDDEQEGVKSEEEVDKRDEAETGSEASEGNCLAQQRLESGH